MLYLSHHLPSLYGELETKLPILTQFMLNSWFHLGWILGIGVIFLLGIIKTGSQVSRGLGWLGWILNVGMLLLTLLVLYLPWMPESNR